jgi:hypothetical protein
MVYRRFGYLQARLLLEKQERLRLLEEKLDSLDKQQTLDEEDELALCTMDLNPDLKVERGKLMADVEKGFNEYGKLCTLSHPYRLLTVRSRSSPEGSGNDRAGTAHIQRIPIGRELHRQRKAAARGRGEVLLLQGRSRVTSAWKRTCLAGRNH